MARDIASPREGGLSLWLTDWKITATGLPWQGRRLVVLVGGELGGHLDYGLHPDGGALTVALIHIYPEFQGRGLAGVLMDALYAAHPTAWINPGWRTAEGAMWWNGYQDPAPERNVHNRPPSEWATYFNAADVAADKAQNAHLDKTMGLHGHQDAVYRYGERTEEEALSYAPAHVPVRAASADPSAHPLHGAARLILAPSLHSYVHDSAEDGVRRAQALLQHLGHGNLPREWNTTRHGAFEDAYHEELFQDDEDALEEDLSDAGAASSPAATHVVFTVRPLPAGQQPPHHGQISWLEFGGQADIALEVTDVSWRSADAPATTHAGQFTPAVRAAIAPLDPAYATAGYQARYDETGRLREADSGQPQAAHPYADRAAEIGAVAENLMRKVTDRTTTTPPSAGRGSRHEAHQPSSPRSPGAGFR